ncbi:hypothetical protein PAPHI01_0099 [Pancytospora philotis]|nr:hypothetical protein PAPHI01_0099 [Pancytospora philotis]
MAGTLSVKTACATTVMIAVALPIFIHSFGRGLLHNPEAGAGPLGTDMCEAYSQIIYFCATAVGQIAYALFTSFGSGFLIFPSFENSQASARINRLCTADGEHGFVNTLLCLFLAALLTFCLGFALGAFRAGDVLRRVPSIITITTTVCSGVGMILLGCFQLWSEHRGVSAALVAASLLATVSLMLLMKRYRDPYFPLYFVLGIVAVANTLRLFVSRDVLYSRRLFLPPAKHTVSIAALYRKLSWDALDLRMLRETYVDIVDMAVFPLISVAVNVPTYSSSVGASYDPDKELRAYAFANLFSGLAFYPTYFNCSGSVLFHLCGVNSRRLALFAGVAMLGVYPLIPAISAALPVLVMSLLTQFVGLSLLLTSLPKLFSASTPDMVAGLLMVAIGLYTRASMMLIIEFGLAVSVFIVLLWRAVYSCSGAGFKTSIVDDTLVITAPGILYFSNICAVLAAIDGTSKPVVVDLESCRYVDMSANMKLSEAAESYLRRTGKRIQIRGSPRNFYGHLYRSNDITLPL